MFENGFFIYFLPQHEGSYNATFQRRRTFESSSAIKQHWSCIYKFGIKFCNLLYLGDQRLNIILPCKFIRTVLV